MGKYFPQVLICGVTGQGSNMNRSEGDSGRARAGGLG